MIRPRARAHTPPLSALALGAAWGSSGVFLPSGCWQPACWQPACCLELLVHAFKMPSPGSSGNAPAVVVHTQDQLWQLQLAVVIG